MFEFGTAGSGGSGAEEPGFDDVIEGGTADNPKLSSECIGAGCKTIILEKPGAPTVAELQAIKDEAEKAGVTVLMGYNKVRYIFSPAQFYTKSVPQIMLMLVYDSIST